MAIVFKYFQFAELLFMICSKGNKIEKQGRSFKLRFILLSVSCEPTHMVSARGQIRIVECPSSQEPYSSFSLTLLIF